MSLSVKVSGAYKTLTLYVKVGGSWKELALSNKIAGAWKALTTVGGGGGGVGPCTIPDSLSATGSLPTVTGASRIVTVALGNTGRIQVKNIFVSDTGNPKIKVASGSFETVTENQILTFVSGDAIQARGTVISSLNFVSFDLYDYDTSTLIDNVTLYRD